MHADVNYMNIYAYISEIYVYTLQIYPYIYFTNISMYVNVNLCMEIYKASSRTYVQRLCFLISSNLCN